MRHAHCVASLKTIKKNQVFKPKNYPYAVERTPSGTLYARTSTGQLIRIEQKEKGKRK